MKYLIELYALEPCSWMGAYLTPALSVLPVAALKDRDVEIVQIFECYFERIDIPALLLQVITGFLIAIGTIALSMMFTWPNFRFPLI